MSLVPVCQEPVPRLVDRDRARPRRGRPDRAPYIDVSLDKRLGRTADYWRAAGDPPQSTTFVGGAEELVLVSP